MSSMARGARITVAVWVSPEAKISVSSFMASNNGLERSRGRVFGERRRESMIEIKCLRLTRAKPRVAHAHR